MKGIKLKESLIILAGVIHILRNRVKPIIKAVILPLIIVTAIAMITTCVSNSVEDLYGLEVCDSTRVTWEDPIREILENNCVPCHNEELHYNGVRHDIYEEELIVVNDGRLRGVVNHLPGFAQMPYQLPQLPECERSLINKWIDNGAPAN